MSIIGGVKPFNLANGETHDTGISKYGLFVLTDLTVGKVYVVAYDYYQNGTLVAGDIKLTDTDGYLCLIKTNGGTIKIKNTTGGNHLIAYRMV